MKRFKKILILAPFLGLIFFFSGFSFRYHLPKIRQWIISEVRKQSRQNTPIEIIAEDVKFSLFPIGLQLSQVKGEPRGELRSMLAPVSVDELSVTISILALLQGHVRVSTIELVNPDVIVILKENPFKKTAAEKLEEPPFEFPWEKLFRLPIDELSITNLSLMAKLDEQSFALQLKDFSFSIKNRFESLLLAMRAPFILIKQLGPHPHLVFQLETRMLVDPNEIQLAALKIARESSYFVSSGHLTGDFRKGEFSGGRIDARGSLNFNELEIWAYTLADSTALPHLEGQGSIDLKAQWAQEQNYPNVEFSAETSEFKIDKFNLDRIRASGRLQNEVVKFTDLRAQNQAGEIQVHDAQINLKGNQSIKGTIQTESLDLKKLMLSIGLKEIPVFLQANGDLPCEGDLTPNLLVKCKGRAGIRNVEIQTNTKDTLVKLSQLNAQGEMEITKKQVNITANLTGPHNSKGSGKAEIIYDKGFNISYAADTLDFSEIDDLVGLKLEGKAIIEGSTQGDSRAATMKLSMKTDGAWLADYYLGNVQGDVSYKTGTLTFKNLEGSIESSRYNAEISIDTSANQIYLNGRIPYLELEDVKTLLSRRLPLPFNVSGTGSGQIKAWGPLNFDEMNYDLESTFYRGTVENESFDEFSIKVQGEKGIAHSKGITLTKGDSRIQLEGSISHDGYVDSKVKGRDVRLEQSEIVSRLDLDLVGRVDFDMLIKGKVPSPQITVDGQIMKVLIGDRPTSASKFHLELEAHRLLGNAQLFGEIVTTRFQWPLKPNVPFEFEFQSKEWDFTQVFSIFSQSARQKDFETQLTSNINLRSVNGDFWTSDGLFQIDDLLIKRGPLQLFSEKPMQIIFDHGRIRTKDFVLSGNNSFVRVESNNSTKDRLNAAINGKFNLALLALFTPFLDDLRGPLSFSARIEGDVKSPQVFGSAFIENSSVRIKEFPHSIDKLRADLLFNQKNILINAITAEMADGQISANGKIVLQTLKDIPVDIHAQFENVKLNFPQGIQSSGSGQLKVAGKGFPYLLDIDYAVDSALVSMEFTGTESKDAVKPSVYLPKFLSEESFQPFTFDIDIKTARPTVIKNSLVDAQVKGDMHVEGTPDKPLLTGTFTSLPEGKFVFRENTFEITNGVIEYRNDPPENPTINMSSQTRVTEIIPTENREIRNDYDVRLLAQGKVKNPRLTFESQPPLSEREIVSLLALGVTTTTVDQNSTRGDQTSLAAPGVIGTQIGAQLFESQLGKQFKSRLGVDLKIGSSFNTDENASFPKVTFSKKLSNRLEGSASRTIEPKPTSDVKLEYKFDKNSSVIGFWESKQENISIEDSTKQKDLDKIGVDLEYKFEFK